MVIEKYEIKRMTLLNKQSVTCLLVVGLTIFLNGCAVRGQVATNAAKPQFPSPYHSWIPEGMVMDQYTLRKVSLGMTKQQVYTSIGKPHFEEGFFNVREWNYIFRLEKTKDKQITCQFQIGFDQDMRVNQLLWNRDDCKAVAKTHVGANMANASNTL